MSRGVDQVLPPSLDLENMRCMAQPRSGPAPGQCSQAIYTAPFLPTAVRVKYSNAGLRCPLPTAVCFQVRPPSVECAARTWTTPRSFCMTPDTYTLFTQGLFGFVSTTMEA